MLDSTTKSRIDSARDILVGKVPDPKSQVEQITIALIYKFMDDMDRQSEELGGKATFFKGEFKKYRWADLLDKRLSGHERLSLYAEGIERMNENKNIPQLFRDIFRGVFLPYRDPETLNLFLKEINNFTYGHSEELGNAYEYLLSVLGTQGDAGQFRTPRHIIDFIVSVVDPHKEDTVLDPACGTAGFLISAYKHIVAAHNSSHPSCRSNSRPLTPDERARLMTNFCGYDIAPDMVRLSRVNMYLHGFQNPVIHEYDTLTSEDRWDERYDVIMANPPFMSPKGGIRPHNRFSIQANRSEVLFVDYIAEHLNPGGRVGVIVPEGIIFQSQNAYKALRRMLVENYLWAVVSLPAGVFNPYSGVKTSILFFDRNLVKRIDSVLFVKIENDGFGLGAQRRETEGDELPEARKIIEAWKVSQKAPKEGIALAVSRKRLFESPDVSLSGDRYRVTKAHGSGNWPTTKLEDVCGEIRNGVNVEQIDGQGKYRVSRIQTISNWDFDLEKTKWTNDEPKQSDFLQEGDILLSHINSIDHLAKSAIFEGAKDPVVHGINLIKFRPNQDMVVPRFLYAVMRSDRFVGLAKTFAQRAVNQASIKLFDLKAMEIPLPPLAEQDRLVAELEGYRKIIEAARQIVANYKPSISTDPKWPVVTFGEICERIQYGLSEKLNTNGIGYRTFRMNELVDGRAVDNGKMKRVEVSEAEFNEYRLEKGDILFNRTNSYEHVGRTGIFSLDGDYAFASYLVRLIVDRKQAEPEFVNAVMNTSSFQKAIKVYASRAIGQANISASSLEKASIAVPPLEVQRSIVAEIEAERSLVDSNRELIARFEKKMQARLAEIWGD